MLFDSHIHIGLLPKPLETALELQAKGIHYTQIAHDPDQWHSEYNLWEKARQGNNLALGCHPMMAEKWNENKANELREMLTKEALFQVGEIGLDKRHLGYEPGGLQEVAFVAQLQIAKELNRDFQVHCVGDYNRVILLIKEFGSNGAKSAVPIFHRFGGDANVVRQGLELKAKFSIHPSSFQKKSTKAAIPLIPKDALLFETDADDSFVQPGEPVSPVDVAQKIEALLRDVRKRTEDI